MNIYQENQLLKTLLKEKEDKIKQLNDDVTIRFYSTDVSYEPIEWNELYYEIDSCAGTTDFEQMFLFSNEMAEFVKNKDIRQIKEHLDIYNKFKCKKSSYISLAY